MILGEGTRRQKVRTTMALIPVHVGHSMASEHVSLPSLGRMMVFVDGENLVFRYQAMLEEGREPRGEVNHEKNTYVWQPNTVRPGLNHVIRAWYYTYAVGDDIKASEITEKIKSLNYSQYSDPRASIVTGKLLRNLYPKVFRKTRGKKAKGVDIQLTIDILSNVYMNNVDSIFLVSGDGDYRPVVEEAIRHGKNVYVAALSSGLNNDLKNAADRFIDLDGQYFKP